MESLKRQLEIARFERALTVSESLADHRALMTTTELARINQVVVGIDVDPWRRESKTITLPSGRTEVFRVISDPVFATREKLHQATETAETGAFMDAAINIYVDLVLTHVFEDGNRRTAVLASHYFLRRYGVPVSGLALLELGLGDLRQEGQLQILRETIRQMCLFAQKRRQ